MAGKFLKKGGSMKNIALTWFLFLSLFGVASAESVNHGSVDLQNNIYLLANECGYALDKNITSEISKSSSTASDKVVLLDFYIVMRPGSRPIHGKLSFSCFAAGSAASRPEVTQKATAADEIALEDSGGRYARDIVWQRKYEGKGWGGTIAYVNSIYGDQARRTIPDYFLICPNKIGLACFSFEVVKAKLAKNESDRIPGLLGGIEIIDSLSTTPESSDRLK